MPRVVSRKSSIPAKNSKPTPRDGPGGVRTSDSAVISAPRTLANKPTTSRRAESTIDETNMLTSPTASAPRPTRTTRPCSGHGPATLRTAAPEPTRARDAARTRPPTSRSPIPTEPPPMAIATAIMNSTHPPTTSRPPIRPNPISDPPRTNGACLEWSPGPTIAGRPCGRHAVRLRCGYASSNRRVGAVSAPGGQPPQAGRSRRTAIHGSGNGLAIRSRRGRAVAGRLVALAKRDEQVNGPSTEGRAPVLDVHAVTVEGTVIQVLAPVERTRLFEKPKVFRALRGDPRLVEVGQEQCDVRPVDDGRIQPIPIVVEPDPARAAATVPIERMTQAAQRAMERQVGPFDVGVGPDELKRLVLCHPALAPIEQESEQGLGLTSSGLLAAPALDRLIPPFHPQRTQREDAQSERARGATHEGLVQPGRSGLHVGAVLGKPAQRFQLFILPATGPQGRREVRSRETEQPLVAGAEWHPGQGVADSQLAHHLFLCDQGDHGRRRWIRRRSFGGCDRAVRADHNRPGQVQHLGHTSERRLHAC